MAPAIEWKKLKEITASRNAIKNLKALDPKSLKDLKNKNGKNLLHVAAKHASLAVSKYLIEIGVEVNAKNTKNAHTPLIDALIRNTMESKRIGALYVKNGADFAWTNVSIGRQSHILFYDNKCIATPLCKALKRREGSYQAAADHLLALGWTFDNITFLQHKTMTEHALGKDHHLKESYKKLNKAIDHQDVTEITQLLKLIGHSKRIMSWELQKVIFSREVKSTMIAKLLLDRGAPLFGFPGDYESPFATALNMCRVNKVWILLEQGYKLNNFKILEDYSEFFHYRARSSQISKNESFGPEERESMKDCIRILVEHQGVLKNVNLIQKLPKRLDTFGYLRMEYIAIVLRAMKNEYCNFFEDYIEDWDYYNDIKEELEKIEHIFIENISLIDLLLKTIDEIIPFTRNECLMNKIRSDSFAKEFPCYARTLQFKASKALEKRLLVDHSIDVLSKCLPFVGSCLPVLEKILFYLNDPYLLNLE